MKYFKFILILLFLIQPAQAYYSASFMENGADARPYAMGEAFTAVSGGLNSIYYNPAGLSSLREMEFYTTSSSYLEVGYQSLGWGMPAFSGAASFSLLHAGMGGIPETNLDASGRPQLMGADFSYDAYALLFSYGRRLNRIALGGSLKVLKENLKDKSSQGMGVDVGAQMEMMKGWVWGASIKNLIAPPINWSTGASDAQELNLKLGTTYQTLADRLTLSLDYGVKKSSAGRYSLGAEYAALDLLKIRLGWNEGLKAGIGFVYKNFKLDFAYSRPEEDYLENGYRISLGFTR